MIANVLSKATISSQRFVKFYSRSLSLLFLSRLGLRFGGRNFFRRLRFYFPPTGLALERVGHHVPNFRRALHGANSRGFHGFVLFLGGSHPAADDCSGVAHAAARRGGLSGDESDDRLFH